MSAIDLAIESNLTPRLQGEMAPIDLREARVPSTAPRDRRPDSLKCERNP
jgi:hypothetical protein